jgi:Phosphodiester glycosidase
MLRSRRTRHHLLGIAIAVTALLGTLLAPAASAGPSPRSSRPPVRVIAPGVALTSFIDRRVPIRAYMLWIDPSQGASLGMTLSSGHLGSVSKTSAMAQAANAIAAVNGDYGNLVLRRPIHPFVLNGDLIQTSTVLSAMFSISADGSMRIGKPSESVSVTEPDAGETWPIATWNHGQPVPGDITAYTSAGGTVEATPSYSCSARLVPDGSSKPTSDGSTRAYTVEQAGCFSSRLAPNDGVVISAVPATDEGTFIRSLTPGEAMQIDWSLGWPGLVDAIGGSNVLVQGGKIVLGPCSGAICSRNPRTSIGLTSDGRIVLVVVDGRQQGSVGMSLAELATFMQGLGVDSAMNLDGGGSSTMVIKGHVANSPSDGFERSVTTSIVVLPGH